MPRRSHTLGIDFGTSNPAMGFAQDGMARLIDVVPGAQTLPTAVFFNFDTQRIVYGDPAQAELITGEEGATSTNATILVVNPPRERSLSCI